MPLDTLPSQLIVPTRDQVAQWWLRDFALHNPGADTRPGSEPYAKAYTYADSAIPLYANCVTLSKNTSRQTMRGVALDNEALSLGTQRFPAVGATGAVIISANSGGTKIYAGDVIQIGANFYQCTATLTYQDQQQVPIQGITTGPGTNQNPGVIGQWQIPRPGLIANATVATQADGSGLTGGHDVENDNQLIQRLNFLSANPPASGNDAQIQALASKCPGLFIEQAFTIPCIQGPGSTTVLFTLRATQAGGNRIPNATQIALMQAWLQGPGQLPADLSITVSALIASATNVVLRPTWSPSTPGWQDVTPWPAFTSIGSEPQVATPSSGGALSATYIRVINQATTPVAGQSFAVFDLVNLKFRKKKILTVVADSVSGWDLTIDTSSGGAALPSDQTYKPLVGQFVCPWSDSLDTVTPAVVAYFASLGPGEQVAPAAQFDPGSRMRRIPRPPALYPNQVTQRILSGPPNPPFQALGAPAPAPVPTLATTPSLLDVTVTEPVLPYSTPVGSAGVSSNLLTLGSNFALYP